MRQKKNQSNEKLSKKDIDRILARTASVGVIGNVILAVFKLAAGLSGHSTAMVTDAIHSLSDVFATLIAFIGSKVAGKGADKNHPYGHDRFECIASMLLGIILLLTGWQIGRGCAESIWTRAYVNAAAPGKIALAAAIVSIASKEAMFRYTMFQAQRTGSGVFRADAWHHRSDALSSVGALIGIFGAMMGFPVMDAAAGLVICVVIVFVAAGILRDTVEKVTDQSAGPETERKMGACILQFAGEKHIQLGLDSLITREFGNDLYADIEICVDGNLHLSEAHEIADMLHDRLEESFPRLRHAMIHVNPAGFEYKVRG